VMVAMAIACGPSLLIADEPTTALDVTVQRQILDLLLRMTEQHKMALLFITHNLRLASRYSHRVAILYAGLIVELGVPKEIFEHPQHPYTECLLAALPEVTQKGTALFSIRGVVPSPFATFSGCAFADRCPRGKEKCRSKEPVLTEWKENQWVRCFYPSKR
jgi:peptide/nickel transport system ATP-binding protein